MNALHCISFINNEVVLSLDVHDFFHGKVTFQTSKLIHLELHNFAFYAFTFNVSLKVFKEIFSRQVICWIVNEASEARLLPGVNFAFLLNCFPSAIAHRSCIFSNVN